MLFNIKLSTSKTYGHFLLLSLGTLFFLSFDNRPNQDAEEVTPYVFQDLSYFPAMPFSNTNLVTNEGVALGRFLFYDPILSLDSTISCASCHQQQYAFSDGPKQFSTGITGKSLSRNTMPLFNLAWYSGFFWDGKASTIESQAFFPVVNHDEMGITWPEVTKRIKRSSFYPPLFMAAFGEHVIDSTLISKALSQFERTLISAQSKFDKALRKTISLTEDELRGFELMNDQTKGNCLHCHTTDVNPLGTTGKFANNGLDVHSSADRYIDKGRGAFNKNTNHIGQFKIPSLRNIMVTGPYMHDGRFESIEAVLEFYSSGVNPSFNLDKKMRTTSHLQQGVLTKLEQAQIIMFLHTLTDSVFLTNPKFSNPF